MISCHNCLFFLSIALHSLPYSQALLASLLQEPCTAHTSSLPCDSASYWYKNCCPHTQLSHTAYITSLKGALHHLPDQVQNPDQSMLVSLCPLPESLTSLFFHWIPPWTLFSGHSCLLTLLITFMEHLLHAVNEDSETVSENVTV